MTTNFPAHKLHLRQGNKLLWATVCVCVKVLRSAGEQNRSTPHTHHSRLAQEKCLLPIHMGAEKQMSRHWMDRAPAAWWLRATVRWCLEKGDTYACDYLLSELRSTPLCNRRHVLQ